MIVVLHECLSLTVAVTVVSGADYETTETLWLTRARCVWQLFV